MEQDLKIDGEHDGTVSNTASLTPRPKTVKRRVGRPAKDKPLQLIEIPKRKVGRPRKETAPHVAKPKYRLIFESQQYSCNSMREMSEITGKSIDTIYRLLNGFIKFKKTTTQAHGNIKIEHYRSTTDDSA